MQACRYLFHFLYPLPFQKICPSEQRRVFYWPPGPLTRYSHDTAQASVAKGNAPTNVSTVSNIPSQQSTNVSPDVSFRNNQPRTVTASEETWTCPLCGYLVPVKRTNQYYRLVDITPPGTNWKCKLCDQWRP
jgi:rubredoxin